VQWHEYENFTPNCGNISALSHSISAAEILCAVTRRKMNCKEKKILSQVLTWQLGPFLFKYLLLVSTNQTA
jgi:hypothetical protein